MSWVAIAFVALLSAPGNGGAEVMAITTALQSDSALLSLHRGYTAYLQAHPDVAQLESAYGTLCRTAGFGAVAQAFDEALGGRADTERAYSRYSSYLATNASARSIIANLTTVGNELAGNSESNGDVLDFLRGNPERAASALTNSDAVSSAPESIRPLMERLLANPAARQKLLDGFQTLSQTPGVKENVYPWWQEAQSNAAVGPHARALDRYIAGHADRGGVWYNRAATLASTPDVRAWIRYWHGRVQRQPVLSRHYWGYQDYMKAHQEELMQVEKGWAERFGPAPKWPPAGAPPALGPLRVVSDKRPTQAGARTGSSKIQRPSVARPARPPRPELRTAPVKTP